MSWHSLYPSQILFFPFHSLAKTCWETTTFVETDKNQYSLNSSSFPHLFKQCSGLFSPAWFNTHINYIILGTSCHNTVNKADFKTKCCVLHLLPLENQTFLMACVPRLQCTCAKLSWGPLLSSAFPESLILSFPRIRVKYFFLKRKPAITIF